MAFQIWAEVGLEKCSWSEELGHLASEALKAKVALLTFVRQKAQQRSEVIIRWKTEPEKCR